MIASRYQAAIPPSISNLDVKVSSDVATLCREASTEVTRFGTELGTELGPFASIVMRCESASSSQVEQLTASAERVLMAEAGDTSRKNATLIASNTAAMRSSLSMADDLTSHSNLDRHSSLLGDRHPERAGKWRTEPVWIGGSATNPQRASFVPPYHERVPTLIDDLIRFHQRTDIDPSPKRCSRTLSSRRSTRSPTAMVAPGGRSSTRCPVATASRPTSRSRSHPVCSPKSIGTSMRSGPTATATRTRSSKSAPTHRWRPSTTDANSPRKCVRQEPCGPNVPAVSAVTRWHGK